MEDGSISISEDLSKLLADTFPHFKFPQVQYEEKTEADGKLCYTARIKLLGQVFSSNPQVSREAALNSVCSVAYEVAKEFKQMVLLETNSSLGCESLVSLFRPLQQEANKVAQSVTQEALRSVSEINNRLIEVENEKINLKVKAKNDKIIEKMQISPISVPASESFVKIPKLEQPLPSKTESIEKRVAEAASVSSDPNIRSSPLNISEDSSKRKTNIGAPIPAFYEYVEKQSSSEPIVFDDFVKGPYFGCRLRWGKRYWIAPAEHRQKKDAHNLAAVMACIEIFGEGFTFEAVDPRIYVKWTRESVRKSSDTYSFATSDELLAGEKIDSVDFVESVDVTKLKVEPLADGRKFMSVINEICQKMRFTPPNYQVSSVNALTNYYVCTVKNFHDLPPIESLPFTKKNESKEDAAGKIYYILKQKGIVDEASRIIGRQKTLELSISDRGRDREREKSLDDDRDRGSDRRDYDRERGSTISPPLQPSLQPPQYPSNVNTPTAPLPQHNMNMNINTNTNPNMNMMQMMPMFMMTQMSQQQQIPVGPGFNPQMMQNFELMMNQWQAFLAWQQQQQGPVQPPQVSQIHQATATAPHPHHYQHQNQNQNQQYNHGRSYEDERSEPPRDPRQGDRRSSGDNYSRKRNYEESRRRYYD